jgi:hypothetical protein
MQDNTRQLFIKSMSDRGYREFIPGCVLLGFSLDNGQTYIGYDDELDQPYYIAVKSTGKIIATSFIVDTLINNWLKFELPLIAGAKHKQNNVFSFGDMTLTVTMSKFCVYINDNAWFASFQDWDVCLHCINNYNSTGVC